MSNEDMMEFSIKREYKLNIVMGICTRGVFPALDFTADFPPAAPGFYQRTHCVHLKNLGTTDKNLLTKSSTKRFRECMTK